MWLREINTNSCYSFSYYFHILLMKSPHRIRRDRIVWELVYPSSFRLFFGVSTYSEKDFVSAYSVGCVGFSIYIYFVSWTVMYTRDKTGRSSNNVCCCTNGRSFSNRPLSRSSCRPHRWLMWKSIEIIEISEKGGRKTSPHTFSAGLSFYLYRIVTYTYVVHLF